MWHRAGPAARNRAVSAAVWLLLLAALLLGLLLWPHAALRDGISTSIPVLARDGTLLRLTLAGDQQYRLWTPLDRIAPVLVDSALLYEDRGFWYHPGVNPLALLRSVLSMAQGGRRAGGSTVTMQLARRLYRIDSRTFSGKLQQIAAAFWLEARYSKHAILEAYLNTVPYGGNIEGVGAASLIYFRHDAAKLTLPEALTLAVIPQNPTQRLATRLGSAQDAFGNAQNAQLEAARGRLWSLWQERYPVAAKAHASEAMLHLPALSRASLPFMAPHLTDMLIAQAGQEGVRSADGAIHSTIDVAMQRTVERVMASYLQARANIGLRNASAVLLDASTMEVRALVGSANYADAKIDGQFNGTQGKRSPGSTLKPFIYALALDQGLLHPRTILRDAPTSFGAFTPENFDGQFEGPVAAQDALTRSRNIPAVSVASRLTQPNLYQYLQMSQISRLQSEDHYGLALVLGGGEVTPEELARMYAVLANEGQARPLAYTRDQSRASQAATAQVLLSPAAAFITLDMLRQTPRPDTGGPAQPPIAWKTGTSWAFRDAWTAGVFGRHVLVVWWVTLRAHPTRPMWVLKRLRRCSCASWMLCAPRGWTPVKWPIASPQTCAGLKCAPPPAVCQMGCAQPAARPGLLPASRPLPPVRCTRRCGSTPKRVSRCVQPMLPMASTPLLHTRRWLSSGAARCSACFAKPDCPGAACTAQTSLMRWGVKPRPSARLCAACATCWTPATRRRCCCAPMRQRASKRSTGLLATRFWAPGHPASRLRGPRHAQGATSCGW